MPTSSSNYNSKLLPYLLQSSCFNDSDFKLIDVGVSGGIDGIWNQFKNSITAVGFDPLVSEIKRLNSENKNEKVAYVEGWVGCNDKDILAGYDGIGYWTNQSVQHSSAMRAVDKMNLNYAKKYFNQGEEVIYSDTRFTLDEYCSKNNIVSADFLKIDTDGYDFFVLNGADDLISNGSLLGLEVEVQLHGNTHPNANLFSNIDLYLRKKGFTLFDLELWKYTKGALPGDFYYTIPAQTKGGQVQWGEAIYFLSPGNDDALLDKMIAADNPLKFLNLIALYDIFGQADSIAELVIRLEQKQYFIDEIDYQHILNLIVPPNKWGITEYAVYIEKFDEDPTVFYPEK